LGVIFILQIIIALTSLPFWGYYWLGTSKSEIKSRPENILLLGGSGMPSESNLMRSWFTAKAVKNFPTSKVFIVMPGSLTDSSSTPVKMKSELIERGVNPINIFFEEKGTNTRSQAINCSKLLDNEIPVLLITSPENMRRTVMCFKKAGFKNINALPCFENAAEADFSFADDDLGGNKILVPDIGHSMTLRYQVWNHLKYEIIIVRECFALAYYKMRGWI
jgi:uncharacterized SAM-binding protein YcdF (DUF218 family)